MNSVRLGGMIWNDDDSDLVLALKDDLGNVLDFTLCTAIGLQFSSLDGADIGEVTGTALGDPTTGLLHFPAIATAVAEPPFGTRPGYTAVARWKKPAATRFSYARTEVSFFVRKFVGP